MADEGEAITIEDLLAEAVPKVAVVKILLRQDLVQEHERLDAELQAAIAGDEVENRNAVAPALARRLADLGAEIEAAKREFRFQSIGRRAWADLLKRHPPTKEQLKLHGRLDHNPETFPLAAIAASCVSPKLTVEQLRLLEERMNSTQFDQLWNGCVAANVGGDEGAGKSLAASAVLHMNLPSAGTADREGSLAASSSDE